MDGILATTHTGCPVLLENPYVTLAATCRSAGLTSRQTQVIVEVARGRSNAEIAARLRIQERTVEEALVAGTRKLQDAYERAEAPKHSARDLLRCLRNRRSCNPRVGGAPAAQAFGTQPGDLRRVRSGTGFLLELACRLRGAPLPMPGRRVGEVGEEPHREECVCARCARARERQAEYEALGRNRRERRAALFARESGLAPRRSTGIA